MSERESSEDLEFITLDKAAEMKTGTRVTFIPGMQALYAEALKNICFVKKVPLIRALHPLMGVDKETGVLDYDKIQETAIKEQPKLIIAGASAYSRDIDFRRFREIADSVNALLLADISHPAGMIAKGILNDPLPHCHVVTSTTHKTLRGPRGGIIMMGKDFENPFGETLKSGKLKKMSMLLNSAVFPGNQGGPLEHVIAAKAIAFGEALTDEFLQYQIQVKKNAAKMAEEFVSRGYNIICTSRY